MNRERSAIGGPAVQRVSTIELFFDLVFVFAITQVTSTVVHPHGPGDYVRATLVFLSLAWMYSGYIWLTSNIVFDRAWPRQLLILAMAGFFTMALSIPDVFGDDGLPYALGLLTVVVIHAFLFSTAPTVSADAIGQITGYNFASAGLILMAAFVRPPWDWPLWAASFAVLVLATVQRREEGFSLSPAHFVERNGLLMIVALGESIVAVGLGARGLPLDGPRVAAAILSLLLSAGVWSTYFYGDDRRAERTFAAADPVAQVRMAILAFGYAQFVMIAGIILIAAGLETGIAQPTGVADTVGTWNLAVGLAIYLVGNVAYRWVLRIGPIRFRLALAALMLATVPLGRTVGAVAHVALCLALLYALWLVESRSVPSAETTSPSSS